MDVFTALLFYGVLTINGDLAPTGTDIKGMVETEEKTYAGSYATNIVGAYGSRNMENPMFEVDCVNGELIHFAVEVTPGTFVDAEQTGICNRGSNTDLNLSIYLDTLECTYYSEATACNTDTSCEFLDR